METYPRYLPFVRRIHRSPLNSPHKGQWREALMFTLICAWINGWVNNRKAGDLRRHRAPYDVIVMIWPRYNGTAPYDTWSCRLGAIIINLLERFYRYQGGLSGDVWDVNKGRYLCRLLQIAFNEKAIHGKVDDLNINCVVKFLCQRWAFSDLYQA